MIERPRPSEYAPYFSAYLSLVPEGDILEILRGQIDESIELFSRISEVKSLYSYSLGKWTIKEIVGHLADTERIFAYRALSLARGEKKPLQGFEQDDYVAAADFNRRPFSSICGEFQRVREASLALYAGLAPDVLQNSGIAGGNPWSVRALVYITAGHELHHRGVLQGRYLSDGPL